MERKKFTIKLNNLEKIEQLLQETYDQACQQYNEIQYEINKIAESTVLNDLDIDGKEKYAKAINNYIALQQKSIGQKFDIAKLMGEICKHGGDINGALDEVKQSATFDITKLRKLAEEASTNSSNQVQTETYITKK